MTNSLIWNDQIKQFIKLDMADKAAVKKALKDGKITIAFYMNCARFWKS